jgi:hypothetical protein
MIHRDYPFLGFPAKAGIHFCHGHRPEFILGPAMGRTRGPVWRDFWFAAPDESSE